MRKTFRLLAIILLFAMLLPTAMAFAAEGAAETDKPAEDASLASPVDENSIIDGSVLSSKIENFLKENSIDPKKISVGYYYSATGDSWYYNGDKWFYPASMYKVPLVMLLAEKVHSGELTQDGELYDSTVAEAEKHILTYSNNHWAHVIRKYLGGDDVWREDAKKYAQLKDDEYDPDYMDYCYFSNRYMTQVMATLYNERERFPNVVECLLEAEPGNYYEMNLGQSYEIAQKYGSFEDSRGEKFNHCTAIIYTPNPCIVTVMTSNVTKYEWVIAELGDMLVDYTLQLDGQLDSHKQQLEEAAAAEELRRQEEELEAQRRLEEQQRLEAEQAAQRKEQEKKDAQAQKRKETTDKLLKGAGALVGAAVLVLAVTLLLKLRPQKRYDTRRPTGRQRYYEDEEPYDEPYEPYPERYDDREDEAPYETYEDERGYEPRRPAPEYRERRPAPARERRQEREPRDRGGRRGSGKYTPKH